MLTGEQIKEARLKAGLTQRQLAAELGVKEQAICRWEKRNRFPRYETAKKIEVWMKTQKLMGFGRWLTEIDDFGDEYFKCNICRKAYYFGKKAEEIFHFCPNCGAEMMHLEEKKDE